MANDVRNDSQDAGNVDQSLSIEEATQHYNLSERTIRRYIKQGRLEAFRRPTTRGFEWRVQPGQALANDAHNDGHLVITIASNDDQQMVNVSPAVDTVPEPQSEVAMRALELADRLQRENAALVQRNEQLAGQLGFVQAKLQDAEEQIRLLSAPKEEPEPAPKEPELPQRQPWWRRFLGNT